MCHYLFFWWLSQGLMHVLEKLSHSHEMPFALRNFTVQYSMLYLVAKFRGCSNGQNLTDYQSTLESWTKMGKGISNYAQIWPGPPTPGRAARQPAILPPHPLSKNKRVIRRHVRASSHYPNNPHSLSTLVTNRLSAAVIHFLSGNHPFVCLASISLITSLG